MVETKNIRLWRGKFKVKIVKSFGTDKQNCLVEALEDYSKIKKGEQRVTRRENLEEASSP